jgi:Ala-tRNA(Pro) deacylase
MSCGAQLAGKSYGRLRAATWAQVAAASGHALVGCSSSLPEPRGRSAAMKITDFLHERDLDFEVIPHTEAFDAQHLASTIHVTGRLVAKTVLLRLDGPQYAVAVLPATKVIDFELASNLLGVNHVSLATEIEIARMCPDCEIGALPPFGSQYGMKTLVDSSFARHGEIFFEGNSHTEAIRMNFDDFLAIERPQVGRFAISID